MTHVAIDYREIFADVWRTDTTRPGYAVVDLGPIDSRRLRQEMIRMKHGFSSVVPFQYSWLTRFNQQVTTKFHKDGGPPENLLILGYEPSDVTSTLYLADYPDFTAGEEMPPECVYTVPQFAEGHSYIVVINNSKAVGVWHKALVVNPDPTKRRVVNSMQLARGQSESDESEMESDWLAKDGCD